MSGDPRPLLALTEPQLGERIKSKPPPLPTLSKPGAARQGERLGPRFKELASAFDGKRAELSDGEVEELDPELVLVFDLAGNVKDFHNAVKRVDGLEFLAEHLDEESDPDDDFHMVDRKKGRTDARVGHSLYLVMSNARAAGQLVSLFQKWLDDPEMKFDHGLAKFRKVFEQLKAIRRWGPEDRVRDTLLIEQWREHVDLVGDAAGSVSVEIEFWYRSDPDLRSTAEAHIADVINKASGEIKDRADIPSISYHALLAELPVQQVHEVLENGVSAIQLLTTDEIMFVSPYAPMSVSPPEAEPHAATLPAAPDNRVDGPPRIALLDGVPFVNHEALTNRVTVDDPDDLSESYPLSSRSHGTAMASQIIHGDLSAPSDPLERSLYVRPIMQPHEFVQGDEQVLPDRLFPDLLHRAIRRITEGEGEQSPSAPSVRIVNLSIGAESRALVRKMSPVGRLLDWLAVEYNLLFIVSAGNHRDPIVIPSEGASDSETAGRYALAAVRSSSRLRGILPPGDAINAVTVGATHHDAAGEIDIPDDVWDLAQPGSPALYSATGPGVGRSIKPDLLHSGGRVLYTKPLPDEDGETVELKLANATTTGPGIQVAAPGGRGATNATVHTYGTSNATALVTHEADRIFDTLEAGADSEEDPVFPGALYHPILTRALLIHASEWGDERDRLQRALNLNGQNARRELAPLLGYGTLDLARLGLAATNRAVLIAGNSIEREQRHTYDIPLPSSIRSKAEWHRVTVTLACMAPTVGSLTKYRSAKVFFGKPDERSTGGKRVDVDHYAVRRGSCQHEVIEGSRAMVPGDDGTFPIHVQCMDDAQRLKKGRTIRYGLVVSVETAVETSTTIHDEARTQLRAKASAQARERVSG